MASKFDQSFIDNLQKFTDALEGITELMQKQQDKGGDAVNTLASGIDADKINQITEQIKSINDNIDNKAKQILDEIKASRKQKESGLFDKVENKENKNKIVDGIKTVILIAGGVLSIGIAFKIIGKVDFLSVIALSMGMMMVAHAFAEIAKIKELTIQKTTQVGLALISIAAALTISSFFLKAFQPLNTSQMLSFVVVSAALGVGAYFIFKAVDSLKMKPQDTWKYLLLPVILPAIALGIVASSWILKLTAPVGFMQAVSAIFVGAVLVVGSIAVYMVLKALKGKEGNIDIKGVGLALALIPGIAGGIVIASWFFQGFLTLRQNPFQVILSSLAMGIAMIAFLPAVYVLGKKMTVEDMLTGVIGAILLSTAIAISSHIINEGIYTGNYPSWKWALGVGLSLILFSPAVWLLGHLKPQQLLMGGLGAIIVSVAIMATSWIITLGKYDGNYPDWKWALGVGLSLIMFTPAIIVLGLIAMTGIGALAILAGAGMTLVIAASIVGVSHILNMGKYDAFPPSEWANGVGLTILKFSGLMVGLGLLGLFILIGNAVMLTIASSIVTLSHILNMGKYDTFPATEWTNGVGLTILKFSGLMITLAIATLPLMIGAVVTLLIATSIVALSHILNKGIYTGGPTKEWLSNTSDSLLFFAKIAQNDDIKTSRKDRKGILNIAESMVEVADILSKGNFTSSLNGDWTNQLITMIDIFVNKIPQKDKLKNLQDFIDVLKDFGNAANKLKKAGIDKLSALTASVTIMSVIDDQKLKNVINTLDDNKDKISNVIEGKELSKSESFKQKATEVVKSAFGGGEKLKDKQDIMIEKFDTVIKKFDTLLEYVISEGGPENTGRNDSTKR